MYNRTIAKLKLQSKFDPAILPPTIGSQTFVSCLCSNSGMVRNQCQSYRLGLVFGPLEMHYYLCHQHLKNCWNWFSAILKDFAMFAANAGHLDWLARCYVGTVRGTYVKILARSTTTITIWIKKMKSFEPNHQKNLNKRILCKIRLDEWTNSLSYTLELYELLITIDMKTVFLFFLILDDLIIIF